MHHVDNAEGTIEVVRRIAAPPEIVFRYLTDSDRFTQWMGTKAELDPQPGGLYRIHVGPGQVASGRYEVIEPPHRLVFTWGWEGDATIPAGSTRVEVALGADGAGTLLTLLHTNLPSEPVRDMHGQGWNNYLDALAEAACRAQDEAG